MFNISCRFMSGNSRAVDAVVYEVIVFNESTIFETVQYFTIKR